jgi:hypothetical protein
VALFDEESNLIWESSQDAGTRVALAPDTVARLQKGGTFYWRVTVRGASGASTSPLLRFDVRP